MNAATKQILKWHLAQQGVSVGDADLIVTTLSAGIAKGEADSMQATCRMLAEADANAASTEDAELIARLFQIHFELQGLSVAKSKVNTLIELREIVVAPRAGGLAGRVQNWRADALIKEYQS